MSDSMELSQGNDKHDRKMQCGPYLEISRSAQQASFPLRWPGQLSCPPLWLAGLSILFASKHIGWESYAFEDDEKACEGYLTLINVKILEGGKLRND